MQPRVDGRFLYAEVVDEIVDTVVPGLMGVRALAMTAHGARLVESCGLIALEVHEVGDLGAKPIEELRDDLLEEGRELAGAREEREVVLDIIEDVIDVLLLHER